MDRPMTRGGRAKERDGPERRCIATGDSGPTGRLVRFVLGPDGAVVPDLAEKLPGRGAWLTADRALVDKAVAKRLFARAFRRPVSAPADLADLLERLLADRLVGTISLARKAGAAVTGFEKVRDRLGKGLAGALVTARGAGRDGRDKLERAAAGVPRIGVLDPGELGLAFGRDFAIHAALDAGGFADRALFESNRLAGLRLAGGCGTGEDAGGEAASPHSGQDAADGPQGGPGQDIG